MIESDLNGRLPVTRPARPGTTEFDRLISELITKWELPGGAVGVVESGRLVLARGYGYADVERTTPVTPEMRFRTASVSKPITAVVVLRLVDHGRLSLDDRAVTFLDDIVSPADVADPRVQDITIRMLLQHSGGWGGDGYDPMFNTVAIARSAGVAPPAGPKTIIRHMFAQELDFSPGTKHVYSNFGYCILGRIIERVTGESYESAVHSVVLDEMGINGIHVGHSSPDRRALGEVAYESNSDTASVFATDRTVPFADGGFYLEGMDAHGGWVASVVDLLRFVTHVDGRGSTESVLSPEARRAMVGRPTLDQWADSDYYYALGWNVRPEPDNWWHAGSLPGTSSILVRAGAEGRAWVALFNGRPAEYDTFHRELDRLLWEATRSVEAYPAFDFFEEFD